MRFDRLVDPVARRLLHLRTVGRTQWLLRALGVLATVLALLLAVQTASTLLAPVVAAVTVTVVVGLVLQVVGPDTDLGVLPAVAILLVLLGQIDLTALRALGVGLGLLGAHSAFALAATLPVQGEFDASAWRLAGRALLPVVGASLLGTVLVAVLSGVQLGVWMMLVGMIAVIVLLAALFPRTPREEPPPRVPEAVRRREQQSIPSPLPPRADP